MSYKSVKEILNAVFDSSDSTLKTAYKTDGEVFNLIYDPDANALRVNIEGFTGGTSGGVIDGEVATFSDLPIASEHAGDIYIVLTATGVPLINRKQAGMYRSDGSVWSFLDIDLQADKVYYSGDTFASTIQEALDGIKAGTISVGNAASVDGYTPEQLAEASYNAIINPLDSKHIVNQRDAGIVTTTSFVCDRWLFSQAVGGGSTSGEAGVINVSNDEQALEVRGNVTGGSGTEYISAIHRINDVRTFSNETAILSFDVESDDNGQMIVYVQQNFGSGGSAAVVVHNDYIDVSTDKTRVSISMNFPSVIGKTIGDNSFVNILITKQTGASSFTGKAVNLSSDVRISNVKFGYNDIYVPVDHDKHLKECQKFYFVTRFGDPVFVRDASSVHMIVKHPVDMYRAPDVTLKISSVSLVVGAGSTIANVTLNGVTNNERNTRAFLVGFSGLTSGHAGYTLTDKILEFNAEI